MKNISLKLEGPCHEKWDHMKPNGTGNYCELCSKTVIDFTALSPKEIRNKIESAQGSICVRITAEQLHTPIIDFERTRPYHLPYPKMAAGLLVAASVMGSPSCATPAPPLPTQQQNLQQPPLDKEEKVTLQPMLQEPTNMTSLHGTVISEQTNCPIEHAKITFFTLQNIYVAYTAKDGMFSLQIPSGVIDDANVIRISFTEAIYSDVEEPEIMLTHSHKTEDVILSKEDINSNFVFNAQPNWIYLGGIGFYPDEKKPVVLNNGVEIEYKEFIKARQGKSSNCKLSDNNYYYFNSEAAIAIYGEKAKHGLYLFYTFE